MRAGSILKLAPDKSPWKKHIKIILSLRPFLPIVEEGPPKFPFEEEMPTGSPRFKITLENRIYVAK